MGMGFGTALDAKVQSYRDRKTPARGLAVAMYKQRRVSVVMPAFNEAEGIEASVRDFFALPEVDEVVVADNNSQDGTADLARRAGARVVTETRQGYGYACRAALAAGEGEYLIVVEPDQTFLATDIYKFLAYAEEFDVIFGTRTSKTCIWSGSNMGPFLRYGNWAPVSPM